MKKICWKLWIVTAVVAMIVTGCSKEDYEEHPEKTFTVMLYGCGGATLDEDFFINLKQILAHGATENVKVTVQMKLSKKYVEKVKDVGNMKGTFRMVVGEAMDTTKLDVFSLPTIPYADTSLPLTDPKNLTDFILWSKATAPADEYVLVLWNHGGGWSPNDDIIETRGILYDDNISGNRGLTIKNCVKGINDAGVRLKILLSDACNMHMLENIFDYSTVADYALGAAQPTPELGTNYYNLLKHLNISSKGDDELLETQLHKFADEQLPYWMTYVLKPGENNSEYMGDMGVVNLRKLGPVAKAVSNVTEELCSSYERYGKDYDQAAEECHILSPTPPAVFNMFYCNYDASEYFHKLAAKSGNARLVELAQDFDRALSAAQYRKTNNPVFRKWQDNVSIGIIVTNAKYYNILKYNDIYTPLEFDKQSGWSRWLQTNRHQPTGQIDYSK